VLVVAYSLQTGAVVQFYLLATCIRVVLGGSQALSRSLFSHMIPRGQEAQYFSLYEISARDELAWSAPLRSHTAADRQLP
jgi:UMF1 family MFS transporter